MFLSWSSPRSLHREIEPPLGLAVSVVGKTDRTGFGDAFQSRGDIDPVAHQIAVALLDDIAEMDADAKLMRRSGGSPELRSIMPFCTSMAQRTASTTLAELDEDAVAGLLHHPAVIGLDRGIDQIAAQRPQPRQRAILIRAGKSAIADDIGGQDSGKLPGLGHWPSP